MANHDEVVVVSGQRTPFGAFGGSLKDVGATDLAVHAGRAALEKCGIKAEQLEHVVLGNVVQSGSDAAYVPRHVGLKLGMPTENGALGLNRLCGSGFQAWVSAAQMIRLQECNTVLAGGVEQMSQIPYILRGARFEGYRMGPGVVEDYMTSALTDAMIQMPMAITAENLAEKFSISREQCDEYSLLSQTRCKAAADKGIFKSEISAVVIEGKKGQVRVENDEHPKPDVSLEKLKTMKALFKASGTVTAATASGIVDGAAMSVLMSGKAAAAKGLKPLAKIAGWAAVGCDPKIMGIGPAAAIRKVLKNSGLEQKDIDLFEVNEAFAAQYLAVEKELGLDRNRTNLNGGAIAIGHPLGASGTRIMNHLALELQRTGLKRAIGSACIGGGQGIAVLIERI